MLGQRASFGIAAARSAGGQRALQNHSPHCCLITKQESCAVPAQARRPHCLWQSS